MKKDNDKKKKGINTLLNYDSPISKPLHSHKVVAWLITTLIALAALSYQVLRDLQTDNKKVYVTLDGYPLIDKKLREVSPPILFFIPDNVTEHRDFLLEIPFKIINLSKYTIENVYLKIKEPYNSTSLSQPAVTALSNLTIRNRRTYISQDYGGINHNSPYDIRRQDYRNDFAQESGVVYTIPYINAVDALRIYEKFRYYKNNPVTIHTPNARDGFGFVLQFGFKNHKRPFDVQCLIAVMNYNSVEDYINYIDKTGDRGFIPHVENRITKEKKIYNKAIVVVPQYSIDSLSQNLQRNYHKTETYLLVYKHPKIGKRKILLYDVYGRRVKNYKLGKMSREAKNKYRETIEQVLNK